jgi:hypothetical protein
MDINVTVIIQIVHFLIAYYVLERLFFRYALGLIQIRDEQVIHLKKTVAEEKRNSEILKAHVSDQWHRYQRLLQHEVPSLNPPRLSLAQQDQYVSVSACVAEKEEATLQAELSHMLVRRVIQ